MKIRYISLVLLIIIILPPFSQAGFSLPLDYKSREILFGIDSKSLIPRVSIIYKDGKGYLMLTPKILYPIDNLPEKNYIDNKMGLISPDALKNLYLRFIVEYRGENARNNLLQMIPRLGGRILYVFKYLPYVSIELPLENASLPFTLGLNVNMMVDYHVKVFLNDSVPMIKDPVLWDEIEAEYGFEINGSGVTIGILDTGIDGDHPDFYFPNGTCKIIINMSMVPDEDARDCFGHGTHVAGIAAGLGIASNGKYKGVAPGAWIANIKVLDNKGSGYTSWIIRGIETAVEDGVDVINLSLGGGENGDGTDPLSEAVDWAVENGVVVVVAAGNEGPDYSTLGTPAVAKKAITVGAITKNYKIADFSSRGPTGDGRVKPEVVAPGVNIVAPISKDSFLAKQYSDSLIHGNGGDYLSLSGTSMAAPHVSGLAALLIQAHSEWNVTDIRNAIISSAVSLGYDKFTEGAGVVNAYYSVKRTISVSNTSFSITLSKETVFPYIFNVSLSSIDDNSHTIQDISVSCVDFYNQSIDITRMLSVTIPTKIPSNQSVSLELSIVEDIPFSIYMGGIILTLENGDKYSILFSILRVIVFEVNATFRNEYFDTLFFMYDKDNPSRWILPTGFRSNYDNQTKEYSYTEWFYLHPGDYVIYGLSMSSWMGDESIPGVIFIYGKELTVNDNIHRQIEYIRYPSTSIPRQYDNRLFDPVGQIYGFYSSDNTSLIIYQFGVWNLSSKYRLYTSIDVSNPVYINLQYLGVPTNIDNIKDIDWVDYADAYLVSSWVINHTVYSLSLENLSEYTLNTASIKLGSNAYGGFAVFPPKQNYTYIVLGPLYQGLNYTIYTDEVKHLYPNNKLSEFRLFAGFDKNIKDSLLVIIDPSYPGRELEPLKPPFTMFTRVEKGYAPSTYLNISMYLSSSMSPPQFPAGYSYSYNVTVNGQLYNSSKGSGEILLNLYRYKYVEGVYRIEVEASSQYPLYSKIFSTIQFSTLSTDIEPPIIHHMNLDPLIEGDKIVGSILIMEDRGLESIDIKGIWDDSLEVDADVELISTGFNGYYHLYLYRFTLFAFGDALDLDISLMDENGNLHRDIYYSVALREITYPEVTFDMITTPKYVEPGVNTSLIIKSTDTSIYGFKVYLNDTYMGFLRTFGEEWKGNITIYIEGLGVYAVKLESSPLYYHSSYHLEDNIISTILIVEPYTPLSTRVTVGMPLMVGVRVMYKYHHLPASGVTVIINGTKYTSDKDGYVIFKYVEDRICKVSFILNDVYAENDLTYIHTYNASANKIDIIFDRVYIASLNQSVRVNVGSRVKYEFKATYNYDGQPFIGKITFNVGGSLYTISSTQDGLYTLSITKDNVANVTVKVNSIEDLRYNVTLFTTSFRKIDVIFDKVTIVLSTESPKIVGLGTPVNISYYAFYDYDHKPFQGKIYIEPYPYTSDKPGMVIFKVTNIEDDRYGLTLFESNELKIFFDTIRIIISRNYNLGSYDYTIYIKYYSSGEYAEGTIEINGVKYDIAGKFNYHVKNLLPYNILKIRVDVPGFKEVEKSVIDYNFMNIMLYLTVILVAIVIIVIFKRRR